MAASRRCCQLAYTCSLLLFAVQTCLIASPAFAQDHSRVYDPWSIQSWGGRPWNSHFPPSCHELGYFSGVPLRFALGGDISNWPAGSFTHTTDSVFAGTLQGHRVFQVVQDVRTNPEKAPPYAQEIRMKRILLERKRGEFCMIFQEQGTVGAGGTISRMDSLELTTIDGDPVLETHDPVNGNGGATLDGVWTFDNGVLVSLMPSLDQTIAAALKNILPAGCGLRPDRDGLDLVRLRVVEPSVATRREQKGSRMPR